MPQKQRDALTKRALAARDQAYAPYSRYHVGAALLTAGGDVFTGANIENAAYPLCLCAERVALAAAYAAGHRDIGAMAVATTTSPPASPCGGCRQVLMELAPDAVLYLCNPDGEVDETTVRALLPRAFTPSALDNGTAGNSGKNPRVKATRPRAHS